MPYGDYTKQRVAKIPVKARVPVVIEGNALHTDLGGVATTTKSGYKRCVVKMRVEYGPYKGQSVQCTAPIVFGRRKDGQIPQFVELLSAATGLAWDDPALQQIDDGELIGMRMWATGEPNDRGYWNCTSFAPRERGEGRDGVPTASTEPAAPPQQRPPAQREQRPAPRAEAPPIDDRGDGSRAPGWAREEALASTPATAEPPKRDEAPPRANAATPRRSPDRAPLQGMIEPGRMRQINALAPVMGASPDDLLEMIESVSNGRTRALQDLYATEAEALVQRLKGEAA